MEAVARLERPFEAELVPSGGGAPWCATAELPSSPCSQIHGSGQRVKSSPDPEWRRIRVLKIEKKVLSRCFAATTVVKGVRSSEMVVRRLPGCRGAASHPWRRVEQLQRRATGPFWPPARSGSGEGLLCNFFVSLDLSVRNGVSM